MQPEGWPLDRLLLEALPQEAALSHMTDSMQNMAPARKHIMAHAAAGAPEQNMAHAAAGAHEHMMAHAATGAHEQNMARAEAGAREHIMARAAAGAREQNMAHAAAGAHEHMMAHAAAGAPEPSTAPAAAAAPPPKMTRRLPGHNGAGDPLLYPLRFFVKNPVPEPNVLLHEVLRQCGIDLPMLHFATTTALVDGKVLIEYTDLYAEVGDIYNLNGHLGDLVHQPRLHPSGHLELPAAVDANKVRTRGADDIPQLFEFPHPNVQLRAKRGEPDEAALLAAKERFGPAVTADCDPSTGVTRAYKRPGLPDIVPFGGQFSAGERVARQLPPGSPLPREYMKRVPLPFGAEVLQTNDERDTYFPGWRALRHLLEQRLNNRGLVHDYYSTEGALRLDADLVVQLVQAYDITVIKAGCGSGKTFAIAKVIALMKHVSPGLSVLMVSSRRSYAEDVLRVFEQHGFVNYMNVDSGRILEPRVICSLESLQRVERDSPFDVIIIDESPEMFQQMLAKTVKDQPYAFLLFKGHVARARRVVLASDDQSDLQVGYVVQMREGKEDRVAFYEHARSGARGRVAFISSLHDWVKLLLRELREGRRVACPCSSKEQCNQVKEMVALALPGKQVLLCTSDVDDEVTRQITQDAEYLRPFDLLLYTSVLGTGVSLDIQGQFDCVFQYVDPKQRVNLQKQALFRVRDNISNTYYEHVTEGFGLAAATTPEEVRLGYLRALGTKIELPGDADEALKEAFARFPEPKHRVVDPLLLQIKFDDFAAFCVDQADFGQRYQLHLTLDCGLDRFDVDLFALGRVAAVEGLQAKLEALSRQIARKRQRAENMSEVTFGAGVPGDWSFGSAEAVEKRQKRGRATAKDKLALAAGYNAKKMFAFDAQHEPAPSLLTPAVHRDLDQPKAIRHLENLYALVFQRSVDWDRKPLSMHPSRQQTFMAIVTLMGFLGFGRDPLLDEFGVLFHCKMRLGSEALQFMQANGMGLLAIAGVSPNAPDLQGQLFGRGGLKSCFFGGGDEEEEGEAEEEAEGEVDEDIPEFDRVNPFASCPRMVVLNLLNKMLMTHVGIKLQHTSKIKNARLFLHDRVLLPTPQELRMAPSNWLGAVKLLANGQTREARVSVFTLRLGPKDQIERCFELLYDRAKNANDEFVVGVLAERVARRKEDVTKKALAEGVPETMRGSIVDKKNVTCLMKATTFKATMEEERTMAFEKAEEEEI
jgi:hypothetical protein